MGKFTINWPFSVAMLVSIIRVDSSKQLDLAADMFSDGETLRLSIRLYIPSVIKRGNGKSHINGGF